MTLDIKTLLKNLLKKQMSIQHFTAKTEVFGVDAIPNRIKSKIKEEFGEQFLLDANYIVFFRGVVDKDGMKKLFNLTNKAFGEDANRLTEGDFKKISFATSDSSPEPEEEPEEEEPEKEEKPSSSETSSKDAGDSTIDDEVDEIVNESDCIDEDVQIDSSVDAYVFLKITTK